MIIFILNPKKLLLNKPIINLENKIQKKISNEKKTKEKKKKKENIYIYI
jgi:ABC-type Fe3+/spermidine/putrescine transport system ATPase subunit